MILALDLQFTRGGDGFRHQYSSSSSVSSSSPLGNITFAIKTVSRWRLVIGLVIGPPTNHALQVRDAAHLNSNNSQ
jgi:hypothetical protein